MGVTGSFLRSRGIEGVDDNTAAFERSVAAHNAKAATSRERREAQRQPVRTEPAEERSDIKDLMRGLVDTSQTERSAEPAMKGFKASRPLPRDLSERIDNDTGPYGDALRKARADGRLRYDVRKASWVVDGIQAPDRGPLSEDGHFRPGYFKGTARRQAERAR